MFGLANTMSSHNELGAAGSPDDSIKIEDDSMKAAGV